MSFVTLPPVADTLPPVTELQQAHCQRVAAHIRQHIERLTLRTNGALAFADFMREVLYAPNLGYYAAGAAKFGGAGDFVTAPEVSNFFGATVADAFAAWRPPTVLELGAGTGRLAQQFLAAADWLPQYTILELSADLRERQRRLLQAQPVTWCDALPQRIDGLVLANEVLDATPCELIRYRAGTYQRGYVTIDHDAANCQEAAAWCFAITWQPIADERLLAAAVARIPPIEGYTTEINLEAEGLVATLCERLGDGAICLIDYGFPRREYYIADRSGGTLACHFRQHVHFDPLLLPGLQDVTAHVDFTAMAEAAVDAGAQVICYSTQAQFLLASGLLNRMQRQVWPDERAQMASTAGVQKLLAPTEMGELFKVLIVGKGEALKALAPLSAIDQSYRL